MEAAPELPIIQVKRFSKVENSVEEIYEPVNFPWNKAVIRGRNYDYELKGLTYHLGSQMLCHYITAVSSNTEIMVVLRKLQWCSRKKYRYMRGIVRRCLNKYEDI